MYRREQAVVLLAFFASMTLSACGGEPPKKDPPKGPDPIVINNGETNNGAGSCGDGVVSGGEACDSAIESGEGVCPNTCQTPPGTCGTFSLVGSADDCSARCELEPAACSDGDGCCPIGCDSSTDGDCTNVCGDGTTESPELCDGDCPTSCDDGDACTEGVLRGSADTCNAVCETTLVSACVDGDGCCPSGCDVGSDSDCSDSCGDGTVDPGETCDGDCPTSCDDGNSCTTDTLSGSAAACSASCVSTQKTSCVDGDQCCPAGCTGQNDSDCNCAPTTSCNALGYECGSVFNGCSDVNCGTCGGTEVCQNNRCIETYNIGTACNSAGGACQVCVEEDVFGWTDGYCTRTCAGDSPCGELAHCSPRAQNGDGVCMQDCNSNADCTRPGYECFDQDRDGRKECAPSGSGTGPIGAACDAYADCSGGPGGFCAVDSTGFDGGYCTQECRTNGDCPSGAHCSDLLGACVDNCTSNSNCRSGYLCVDQDDDSMKECLPGATGSGRIGDPCMRTSDCSGGEHGGCLTESGNGLPGGYCTLRCGDGQGTCPTGATCSLVDPAADLWLCLDECETSSDCRGGYDCTENYEPYVGVCLF